MKLRPHHGLCIHHFIGKGYSQEFTENMAKIIECLEKEPEKQITVFVGRDDICCCCPHWDETGCQSEQKVLEYDQRCLDACSMQDGEQIDWKDWKEKIKESILIPEKISEICVSCNWLSLCESFYKETKNEFHSKRREHSL